MWVESKGGREKEGEMVTDVKLEGGGSQDGENEKRWIKRWEEERDSGWNTVQTDTVTALYVNMLANKEAFEPWTNDSLL